MTPIRGVIFDLDGVLVHTDELHYRAWSEIAQRLGIRFSREENRRLRGVSREESLDIILATGRIAVSESERAVLADEKNSLYRGLLRGLSAADVDPAVRRTLDGLRGYGLRLAVGSSSRNAKAILQRTGLGGYFDAVSDGDNITRSKPDPEVFLRAAEFLALRPRECAVVEDANAGIDAATSGGFTSFGLGDAGDHPAVTWRIDKVEQVLDHIGV